MSVICRGCGDGVAEYADEETKLGRCCHNLPRTWSFDEETGLYEISRGFTTPERVTEVVENGDEEEPRTHVECRSCGSTDFTATESITQSRGITNIAPDVLWVGSMVAVEDESLRIECDNCGYTYHGPYEYS